MCFFYFRPNQTPLVLVQPSSTRWSSHEASVSRVCVLYPTILETLEKLEDEGDTEATSLGLVIQNKKFVFTLHALVTVLDTAEYATKTLQNSKQTIADTRAQISALKCNILDLSNDQRLNQLFKVVDEICEKENITLFDKLTRRNNLLRYTKTGDPIVDTKLTNRRVFYEILDIILNGIEERF